MEFHKRKRDEMEAGRQDFLSSMGVFFYILLISSMSVSWEWIVFVLWSSYLSLMYGLSCSVWLLIWNKFVCLGYWFVLFKALELKLNGDLRWNWYWKSTRVSRT